MINTTLLVPQTVPSDYVVLIIFDKPECYCSSRCYSTEMQ